MKRKSFIAAVGPVRVIFLAVLFLLLAMAQTVSAHGAPELAAANPWSAWQFTPDIVLATLLVAVLYGAGLRRSRTKQQAMCLAQSVCFYTGLAAMFLALQSPIDTFAEHVFALHQVQHLLLHSLGPMLFMLAAPQGLLIAGMPEWSRRYILAPVVTNRVVRTVFGFIARPAVATFLFVGTLYFWQIPRYHDLAVLNDAVHYSMHVTMLAAGLVFFWRVFDSRPAPLGARYLVRATMLWVTVSANILLGAFLTFKTEALYPAYDTLGRLWVQNALQDELLGGLTIWIPSTMMCVVALLIVIRLWGSHETKLDGWRQRGIMAAAGSFEPLPGNPGLQAQSKNRALAARLVVISLTVFTTVIGVAVLSRILKW